MDSYKEALFDILNCGSIVVAKEIAAEALEVDVEEYLESDLDGYDEDDGDEPVSIEDVLARFE